MQGGFFSSDSAQMISIQLQNLIDEHARAGWDFYSLEKVNIEVQLGCIGQLFGQSVFYVISEQVIFR